jgi:hypothetical protein
MIRVSVRGDVTHLLNNFVVSIGCAGTSQVRVLHVFKYLAPFHKLKYGHRGKWDRTHIIDCVQYCGNAPQMWMPIWVELLHLVKETPLVTHVENETVFWMMKNKWASASVVSG